MKPLTSGVTRLGEISALLQNFNYLWKSFGGSLSDKRNFEPNLGNIFSFGQMLIAVNGQMLNKLSGHTADERRLHLSDLGLCPR